MGEIQKFDSQKDAKLYKAQEDAINMANTKYQNNKLKEEWIDSTSMANSNNEKLKREQFKRSLQVDQFIEQEAKKEKKRIKRPKKMARAFTGIALAGITLLGGYGVYKETTSNQEQDKPISVEQVVKNDKDMAVLGINEEIANEIKDIKEILEDENLSKSELIKLAPRINEIQFDTLKTKLSNTLHVNVDDIKLGFDKSDGESVSVIKTNDENKTYANKDIFNKKDTKTMPKEISNYIGEIARMQSTIENIQNDKVDKKDLKKQYDEIIEDTDNLATSIIKQDEKGNLYMVQLKQKDLDKNNMIDEQER